MMKRILLTTAALVGAALFGGCTVEGRTGAAVYPTASGDAYVVYDEAPPYGIETYPSYVYGGTTVYLVGDRWYYRSPRGWAYYGSEPPALYTYRAQRYRSYGYTAPPAYGRVQTAPPAYGYTPARPYAAPPAYRSAPGYQSAPPAYHAPPAPAAPAPGYRPHGGYSAPPAHRHH